MNIPGPSLPCRVEWGIVWSSLPRPPWLQEETGPVGTDQEMQKKNLPRPPFLHKKHPCQYRHRWLTWWATYMVAKTFCWASPAGGRSVRANRLLCQQAEAARRWPSKTISWPKSPASKTMWKQVLNSHGIETTEVCKWMDGYNQRPLCVGHNTKAFVIFHSEAPFNETYPHVWGESSKDPGWHDVLRGQINAIQGHHRCGPRKHGILYISLPNSQKNGENCFIMNISHWTNSLLAQSSRWPP